MVGVSALVILFSLVFFGLAWSLAVVVPVFFVLAFPLIILSTLVFAFREARAQREAALHGKMRVLVVDDDEISVTPLMSALAKKAMEVDFVKSGTQMVEALKGRTYDLIFLDYLMPDLNGEDALKASERDVSLKRKKMPVIFFTGYQKSFFLPKLKHFEVKGVWDKVMPLRVLSERLNALNTKAVA